MRTLFSYLTKKKLIPLVASVGLVTLMQVNKPIFAQPTTEEITGERWLEHIEKDLNPWWLMNTALGEPVGNFPSFRCNNGELVNVSEPCAAFSQLGNEYSYIYEQLSKNFIVSQASQVAAYSLAYHITGNQKFLRLAKAGVEWIRNNGIDRENGGAFTYLEDPDKLSGRSFWLRTSQEQAHTLGGLASYYYITRDERVLEDIIKLKKFIFDNYYDRQQEVMMWVPLAAPNREDWFSQRKRLVSQLGQMGGYLLMLAPILPEPYQSEWKEDILRLSRTTINEFYSPEYNLFLTDIENSSDKNINNGKFDYGHSLQAFSTIYLTGKLLNNQRLIDFARINAPRLLEQAYDSESGTWGRGFIVENNGEITQDLDKESWIYISANQITATLSLEDSSYVDKYLRSTYDWWFENMVDRRNNGTWTLVSWPELAQLLPKQYQWKNGAGSYEHALIGYITSQARAGENVTLHFARKGGEEKEAIKPYYYTGEVTNIETSPLLSVPDWYQVTVTFSNIK